MSAEYIFISTRNFCPWRKDKAMKYTQIPVDTFQKLQMNAGILVDEFDPETGEVGNLLGATTGGIQFSTNPTFEDFGEDIDNCPNNTKELKRVTYYDPQMSGTFLTASEAVGKKLVGAADSAGKKITPRNSLKSTDFFDLWWVGDYSDENTGSNAGFIAIHLINALNTAGFQIQSTKQGKGQLAFEFHGHYSIFDIDKVPFELYISSGDSASGWIELERHSIIIKEGDTETIHGDRYPADATITWTTSSASVATVSGGTVTGVAEGNAIITAAITVDGVTYNDTCTVIVEAAE